ncbi:UNVERIFIED_CONTAM: hypothetical protein GTU68_011019 [Idotea baltica]|nr:hypothetical protein [Idotea baltica]
MTCSHCHVDAGPDRKAENMNLETVEHCLDALRNSDIKTLDLTGGAPEMNKHFKYFVTQARKLGVHVIDRCNLTILLANGFTDIPEFLAENEVEIVASLPCYLEENADAQRGDGAFRKSIEVLRKLNSLGYGEKNGKLALTLVYNPVGTSLPPNQEMLEAQYRKVLKEEYEVDFTRLFTITNMPISRYLEYLIETNEYEAYMQRLLEAYNPAAVQAVMCKNTLSVGWDGSLYDCDFNQMLELATADESPRHIRDFNAAKLAGRPIRTGRHCYGCTAGAGSSCQGAVA